MHLVTLTHDVLVRVLLGQRSSQLADITQISESHHTPDGFFIGILQKGCCGTDGDTFFVGTNDINGSVQNWETGVYGFAENTITFANIAAEDFKTWPADSLIYGNSGNFFRCAIKVGNAPAQIQRVYTIRDVVQYDLILIFEAFIRRNPFLRILFMNFRRRN